MLPETLVCLLTSAIVLAQTRQQLSLNAVASFNTLTLPSPPSFSIPSNGNELTVSVALCTDSNTAPRFFLSNASTTANPGSSGGEGVIEIVLQNGHGNWTGLFEIGVLAVESNGAQVSFEVGVSDSGPIHEVLKELPFFGDTTSNQALLFSPPFAKPTIPVTTYPNYTLPVASLAFTDTPPSSPPNYTLVLSPTSASSLTSGPQTGCFLSSQNTTGTIANQSLWLRDDEGWRIQWLLEGLSPSTNYTAYAIQDGTKVAGPIYFATKSASFSCPLVASLPFCPAVSHAVPLPAPPSGTIYDSTNLPTNLSSTLLTYLTNFTVTLTTFACGRDRYSPLVDCSDCQREYRKWLCAVSFSRCGEPSVGSPSAFTALPATPTETGLSALKSLIPPIPGMGGGGPSQKQQQVVLSALLPQTTQRNQFLPAMDYTLLLPCLETCTAVERACPPFLLFECPTRKFNAAASYGVGYVDGADGDEGEGVTGAAQDRWGNVWCHLG